MTRLSRDLMALTFFFQRLYISNYILRDKSKTLSMIEGSRGSVLGVVITVPVSPIAVSAVSELLVAIAVAVASGLIYSQTYS